jgi:hypothetical protein
MTSNRTKRTAPSTRPKPYSTLQALREARSMLAVVGFDHDTDPDYKRSWKAALKRIDGALKTNPPSPGDVKA